MKIFCFFTIEAVLKGSLWEPILSFKSSPYFGSDSRHSVQKKKKKKKKKKQEVRENIHFWLRQWQWTTFQLRFPFYTYIKKISEE